MITFRQFIVETKNISEAPYGVIFKNNTIAYVGRNHGKPLVLSTSLIKKIKEIGNKYGYWYEGNGGDVESTSNFHNKKIYEGSWDHEFSKTLKSYPPEFLYTIFTNTNVNKQKEKIPNKQKTIFDSIMSLQSEISYLKHKSFDEKTLRKFLMMCSEDNVDFVKMSQLPATSENVNDFLDKGESLMWPKNWKDYPNKAGKVAKKVDDMRNIFLLSRESGVYFAGAGHLIELQKLDKSLKILGGERAEE